MGTETTHWPSSRPEPASNTLCGADASSSAIISSDSTARITCTACRLVEAFRGSETRDIIVQSQMDGPTMLHCSVCAQWSIAEQACTVCTEVLCEDHKGDHSCLKKVKRLYLDWFIGDGHPDASDGRETPWERRLEAGHPDGK